MHYRLDYRLLVLLPFGITGMLILDRQPGHLAVGMDVIGWRNSIRIIEGGDGQREILRVLGASIREGGATLGAKSPANGI